FGAVMRPAQTVKIVYECRPAALPGYAVVHVAPMRRHPTSGRLTALVPGPDEGDLCRRRLVAQAAVGTSRGVCAPPVHLLHHLRDEVLGQQALGDDSAVGINRVPPR